MTGEDSWSDDDFWLSSRALRFLCVRGREGFREGWKCWGGGGGGATSGLRDALRTLRMTIQASRRFLIEGVSARA